MEGTDEIETSPMSRRSRREPKVPGKLLPLLECLRSITSHKFGSLFKHKLESQNKQQYRNIIRRHMDLGMIRARLEEGSYSGSQEFFRDLLLVFNNALMFYPKSSQEHRAAVVLRELANNEMAKIFQTEALLKQEGPSTRKRDPRTIPGPSAIATKFNPSSRKRNARPLLGGGVRAAPRSKTTGRLNTKEEQYNSQEPPPKEAMEVSSSTGLKPENEPEAENFEAEPPNTSKMPKAGDERKTSGSSIQHKKISGFRNDPKKNSNTEPKKNTVGNNPVVESRNNSHTHKSSSHHHSNNNGRGGTEQLLGKVAAMKEEKGSPPPEPTHKQRTPDQDQPSPLKRGVGRPPKHVKRASGGDDQPPSKATGDPEASLRARKRLRK